MGRQEEVIFEITGCMPNKKVVFRYTPFLAMEGTTAFDLDEVGNDTKVTVTIVVSQRPMFQLDPT
mgnify:CR=1 FL=1